jgi:hypothetical protein
MMIRYDHDGKVGPATVRAVVHTGISITAHGRPARLAILGEDGSVIAEGQAVADAVEAAAVNAFSDALKVSGRVREVVIRDAEARATSKPGPKVERP